MLKLALNAIHTERTSAENSVYYYSVNILSCEGRFLVFNIKKDNHAIFLIGLYLLLFRCKLIELNRNKAIPCYLQSTVHIYRVYDSRYKINTQLRNYNLALQKHLILCSCPN